MDGEAFECMHLTKKKSELSYVIKGNSLKSKSEESENGTVILEKEIKVFEDKNCKLQK